VAGDAGVVVFEPAGASDEAAASKGSHLENGARSAPAGTYHLDASGSQRAPRDFAASFSLNGTLR